MFGRGVAYFWCLGLITLLFSTWIVESKGREGTGRSFCQQAFPPFLSIRELRIPQMPPLTLWVAPTSAPGDLANAISQRVGERSACIKTALAYQAPYPLSRLSGGAGGFYCAGTVLAVPPAVWRVKEAGGADAVGASTIPAARIGEAGTANG